MDLADLQSAEWRARAASRMGKKLLGFTRSVPEKAPVFVAGLQRSGTTMLMNIFHLHPDTEVFDEARDSKTFLDFRIRSLGTVREVIDASHFSYPVFKIIADSHVLPAILHAFPKSKVLWMYREYGANAASRLKKFGHATAAIRKVCNDEPGGGWFAEGVSAPVLQKLQSLDRSKFSEFDYACLVWWVRNRLFFDLDLDRQPQVRLLRYETLVVDPKSTMRGIFDWTRMPSSASSMRFVHAQSLYKRNLPALDPQVEALCSGLLLQLDTAHDQQWQAGVAPAAQPKEMRRVS